MSKNVKDLSSEPDDQPEKSSVYDFLYQDVRRVGSYLAQLTPAGHLQSLKQTHSAEDRESSDTKAAISANAVVAKARGEYTGAVGSSKSDSLERTFDPLWSNAIDLLNLLENGGFLKRDLKGTGLGRFVLVSGELILLDLSKSKLVWSLPGMSNKLEETYTTAIDALEKRGELPTNISVIADLMNANRKSKSPKMSDAALLGKFMAEAIKSLPLTLQARLLIDTNHQIYCPLDEAYLTGSALELLLKHGSKIQGNWYILGILDAVPDADSEDIEKIAQRFNLVAGTISGVAVRVGPMFRLAGRPPELYGLTPLLIFREVVR